MSVSEGPAQIEGIIWLSAGDETVTPALTDIPREEVVQQLALRQAEHQVAYGDITPYLSAATGCTNIEELWRAALSGGLSGVACRRLAFSHARAAEAVELLLSEAAG